MFTARYVLHSTFCPHSGFMCFVWIWEQTAIISLYSIDWLVFITETECVYCAVRTGPVYITLYSPVVTICTTSLTFTTLRSAHTDLRTISDHSHICPLCYLQFSCLYAVSRFDVTPNDFKSSRFARSNLGEYVEEEICSAPPVPVRSDVTAPRQAVCSPFTSLAACNTGTTQKLSCGFSTAIELQKVTTACDNAGTLLTYNSPARCRCSRM